MIVVIEVSKRVELVAVLNDALGEDIQTRDDERTDPLNVYTCYMKDLQPHRVENEVTLEAIGDQMDVVVGEESEEIKVDIQELMQYVAGDYIV